MKKLSVFFGVLALLIAGKGLEANAQTVDLDIKTFRVTNRVSITKGKPIKIVLGVKNNGSVDAYTGATITGEQEGGSIVYSALMDVYDDVGRGSTNFEFPAYTPEDVGEIVWTAVINDDDPDDDVAVAVTRVVP